MKNLLVSAIFLKLPSASLLKQKQSYCSLFIKHLRYIQHLDNTVSHNQSPFVDLNSSFSGLEKREYRETMFCVVRIIPNA